MAPFDMNYFCAYMAIMLANVPVLKKYFDGLYQTDRFRFYKRAKESPLYNSDLMYGGKLETEVTRKRVLGIFLSAQDDENLRDRIRDKIIDYYPPVKDLGFNFSLYRFNALREKFENSSDIKKSAATMINAFFYFSSYIVLCNYGFDTDNKEVQNFYEAIRMDIFRRNELSLEKSIQRIDAVHPKKHIIVPREQRKFYETFQTGNDLMDLIDLCDSLIGNGALINRTQSGIHKERLLASFLNSDHLDVFTMLTLIKLFDTELEVHRLGIVDFLDETPITKEDKDRAMKIVADTFKHFGFEEFKSCSLTAYIMTLLFGVIAKGINDNKNFYFENNNETQYNELEGLIASNDELRAKIKQLQSDLSYQEEYVRILKSQIKDLESNASKNVQDTVQSLNKEITLLERLITELCKRVEFWHQ